MSASREIRAWLRSNSFAAFLAVLVCSGLFACLPAGPAGLNHASQLFERGQYRDAVTEYRRVRDLNPSWSAPHLGLGNAHWALGEREEALQAYREAVRRSPDWSEAYIALGDALIQSQRWSDAVPVLEKASSLAPTNPTPRSLLGIALAQLRRDDAAVSAFESVLRLCETCLNAVATQAYKTAKSRVAMR